MPQVKPYDASRPLADKDKFPEWMHREPGTRAAGFAVSALFPWYFGIQQVCGLLAAATALAWTRTHKARVHRVRAIVLLVALVSVIGGSWLERKVAEKTGPRDTLTDAALQDPTPDNIDNAVNARAEFWKLHGYSMLLNLAVLLLVTTAMALAAQLPICEAASLAPSTNGHSGRTEQTVPTAATSS